MPTCQPDARQAGGGSVRTARRQKPRMAGMAGMYGWPAPGLNVPLGAPIEAPLTT